MDVGASLVAYGHSWVDRRYIKDSNLFSLEKKAKEQQVGLWALPVKERIPPWAWKHGEKYKNSKFVYEETREPSKYKQKTTSAYKSEVEETQFTGAYYKGNKVHTGPRGGRYIYTNSGNKRYLYE